MEDALDDDDIELIEVDDISGVEEVHPRAAATLDALRNLPLFADLPRTALLAAAEQATVVPHAMGSEVVRAGAVADALFAVLRGQARVEMPGLEESDVAVLQPGDVFGEACVLDDEPRHATVTAAEGGLWVLSLPRASVQALIAAAPELGDRLLETLMRRLIVNLLKTNPVFTCLEGPMRRDLAQLFETRKAPPGTVLIEEGKPVDGMYIPLTGKLELSARGSSKRVNAGSVVGQGSMLSHSPSRYAVTTVGDCVLLRLPASRFMDLITMYPPVLELLASRALIAVN